MTSSSFFKALIVFGQLWQALPLGMLAKKGNWYIQLLESPIPSTTAAPVSQKASSDDISGTKSGTIDPLVPKRPETNSE